jgi:hypothetical protein
MVTVVGLLLLWSPHATQPISAALTALELQCTTSGATALTRNR